MAVRSGAKTFPAPTRERPHVANVGRLVAFLANYDFLVVFFAAFPLSVK
jgi:hypothetical protein